MPSRSTPAVLSLPPPTPSTRIAPYLYSRWPVQPAGQIPGRQESQTGPGPLSRQLVPLGRMVLGEGSGMSLQR